MQKLYLKLVNGLFLLAGMRDLLQAIIGNDIAEKYNRPHRKTNALLAGLVHCPHFGRRLSVVSESYRYTNGKPRFKYVCLGYRKKECNFKAVDDVLLDEFIVKQALRFI